MSDPLSTSYGDLLEGSYDCVDRVVLNGYFRRGHNAGGFRHWWRDLWGSEEHLDNTHLMRLAARFSRRLRAWAQAHNLPVVYCSAGERKHELAEQYLAQTAITQGLFLILVSRAPAPVWKVVRRGTSPHLERRHPMPYVNHYSFHVLDPDWGHLTIKISGHPPFPAQILLNGHEYVARQACRLGIEFRKEGNCFTLLSDATALAQLAETLLAAATIGRLRQVCDRWIYSACLCFALNLDEQRETGFGYDYSVYQLEYSRNLLFRVGAQMEQVLERLIDRSRAPLRMEKVKTILGVQRRSKYRLRKSRRQWGVMVGNPAYDLTLFKLEAGPWTLKIYTKGERVLRAEAVLHNARRLGCRYSLENFDGLVEQLQGVLQRFLGALASIDRCFISDQTLERLPESTRLGGSRVPGIDVNRPRMRRVMEAVVSLAAGPRGFAVAQLAGRVQQLGDSLNGYRPRQASYDLRKAARQAIRGEDRGNPSLPRDPNRDESLDSSDGAKGQSSRPFTGSRLPRGSRLSAPPRHAARPVLPTLTRRQQLFDHLGIAA